MPGSWTKDGKEKYQQLHAPWFVINVSWQACTSATTSMKSLKTKEWMRVLNGSSLQIWTVLRTRRNSGLQLVRIDSCLKKVRWREAIVLKQHSFAILGILLSIVFVVLFLIILVLRKRINLAIALIKEGSRFVDWRFPCYLYYFHLMIFYFHRAVGSMMSTLFFPIIPWILQLFVFAWFVAVALYP